MLSRSNWNRGTLLNTFSDRTFMMIKWRKKITYPPVLNHRYSHYGHSTWRVVLIMEFYHMTRDIISPHHSREFREMEQMELQKMSLNIHITRSMPALVTHTWSEEMWSRAVLRKKPFLYKGSSLESRIRLQRFGFSPSDHKPWCSAAVRFWMRNCK